MGCFFQTACVISGGKRSNSPTYRTYTHLGVHVSKQRTARNYRQPTKQEETKIYFTGYELDDIFFEDEIEDFFAVARRRIIAEFFYATERNPRYKYGSDRRPYQRTDNYIIGVSGRVSDLAKHVRDKMHRPFISVDQLPEKLAELSPRLTDRIIRRAQLDILTLVLQIMRHREVWYDEGTGIWQVCQSSMDEYLEYRRPARTANKVDDRNYHGRVRSQSKRRGIPEGVSIGLA